MSVIYLDWNEVRDADAATYIDAVETEDGAYLEEGVKNAYHRFFYRCKRDGNWDDIDDLIIHQGARTIEGALVPAKGPITLTPNGTGASLSNFSYDRVTGLTGANSSGISLRTANALNNRWPQNDFHVAFSFSAVGGPSGFPATLFSANENGRTTFFHDASNNQMYVRVRSQTQWLPNPPLLQAGVVYLARNSSSNILVRAGGTTYTSPTNTSSAPQSTDGLYMYYIGSPRNRILSLGKELDEAAYETAIKALTAEIAAAIP